MSSAVTIAVMEEFMAWPNIKKMTFVAIGNFFKTNPEEKVMKRYDVQTHLKNLHGSSNFPFVREIAEEDKLLFVDDAPAVKMVYTYVDQLLEDGFIQHMGISEYATGFEYKFNITDKGKDLFRRVSFALNYGPDEVIALMSEILGKEAAVRFHNMLDDRLRIGYPIPRMDSIMKRLTDTVEENNSEG